MTQPLGPTLNRFAAHLRLGRRNAGFSIAHVQRVLLRDGYAFRPAALYAWEANTLPRVDVYMALCDLYGISYAPVFAPRQGSFADVIK